jgi:CRISPR system Cascade subunit CasE
MTEHYFSRISMTHLGFERYISSRSHGAYNLHKEMWKLFPDNPNGVRDFLYAVMGDERTIYCVSAKVPVSNEGYWNVETKPYNPLINEGDHFQFRVCVNPTVANEATGKHQRHDVVMDTKRKCKEKGEEKSMEEIVHCAVTGWMERKGAANGFEIPDAEHVIVHSYRRNESMKSGVHKIVFSTAVVEGIMRVTEPELFRKALFEGLGPAKGFGCGLLMIKRL